MEERFVSRNNLYYLNAFEKLESGKGNTWNWAAFFFQEQWMFYRKMYLYGFVTLFFDLLLMSLQWNVVTSGFNPATYFFIVFCFRTALGYFANNLYYQVVKDRIEGGYHLMPAYKATSKSLTLLFPFLPSIYIYYFADTLANIKYFREHKRSSIKIDRENTLKYLCQDKYNHLQGKIAIFVSIFAVLLGLFGSAAFVDVNKVETLKMELNKHISIL